jgi:hypothetical protein
MNEQLHAHQDSVQGEDKGNSGCKVVGIACLLATLVVLSPMGMLFCVMQKGYHDARSAREEFKRTVNADELRAWALMQNKKHPEGGYIRVSTEDLPKTFPRFTQSRGLSLHLDPSDLDQGKRDDLLRAALVWGFFGGHGLKVSIWINPDGTPPDFEDERDWARGITLDILSR